MPAVPITFEGVGEEGLAAVEAGVWVGERRTMTKSRVPFVGDWIVEWRCLDVWWTLVWGAHDLCGFLIFSC